jgi:hypothetical protein
VSHSLAMAGKALGVRKVGCAARKERIAPSPRLRFGSSLAVVAVQANPSLQWTAKPDFRLLLPNGYTVLSGSLPCTGRH